MKVAQTKTRMYAQRTKCSHEAEVGSSNLTLSYCHIIGGVVNYFPQKKGITIILVRFNVLLVLH